MELIRLTINMKNINDIYVVRPLGDIHLGNENCDIDKPRNLAKSVTVE